MIIGSIMLDKISIKITSRPGNLKHASSYAASMTQDGETEGMTASDHVKALLDHSGPGLVDLCLCNSAPVRPGLVERYREEDAAPIVVDRAAIEALGVEAVTRPLASETLNYARHSFARLAEAVMELYNERADTKIF